MYDVWCYRFLFEVLIIAVKIRNIDVKVKAAEKTRDNNLCYVHKSNASSFATDLVNIGTSVIDRELLAKGDNRFGPQFYVASDKHTADCERPGAGTYVYLAFTPDARILDLTNPDIALQYGYIRGQSHESCRDLMEIWNLKNYDAIKYPSEQGMENKMVEISKEVMERWIKCGFLTEEGKHIPALERLKNGTSFFYINSIEKPYTYDNLNVDALELNYSEYCMFREYLLNVTGIDLNTKLAIRYTFVFPKDIETKIGFSTCNLELPESSKYSSPEKKQECIDKKKMLMKKIKAGLESDFDK